MITKPQNTIWRGVSFLIAITLVFPLLVLLAEGINSSTTLFYHLWQTVLSDYIINTLILGTVVVLLSIVFGVISAALIVHTNIAGKTILRWLLMLPLAMPAYLFAYLFQNFFTYIGPFHPSLRFCLICQSLIDYRPIYPISEPRALNKIP